MKNTSDSDKSEVKSASDSDKSEVKSASDSDKQGDLRVTQRFRDLPS